DPKPGGHRAVAVVQGQRVGLHGGRRFLGGKAQGTGALQHAERGSVGSLAGEIFHRYVVGPGGQGGRRRGEGDLLIAHKGTVVLDLQRAAVLAQGGDTGKGIGEGVRRQRQ